MDQSTKNIQMRLVSANEVRFQINLDKIVADADYHNMQIGFSTELGVNLKENTIAFTLGTKYTLINDDLIECVYRFVFQVVDLQNFVKRNEDDSIEISHIMPHILNVALGTMRGILLVKSAGTILSQYPLPMINIDDFNKMISERKK